MKRTHFLLGAASGLALVAGVDSLFSKALMKPMLPGLAGGVDNRVFVIVNLKGGNDGLNTIVPHGMRDYYRLRPSLAIPRKEVLTIDKQIGFNPVMKSFQGMFEKGQVAVVQGVGYPDPDHSHFRSSEIWQTAAPGRFERTGWLGRYLDEAELPKQNLFNAIAVSQVLPEVLVARRNDVPAIPETGDYQLTHSGKAGEKKAFISLLEDEHVPFHSPYLKMVAEIEGHARRGSEMFPQLLAARESKISYPDTPFGRSLSLAAQIIGSWMLGTRIIYVEHGSFDTHAVQKGKQEKLLAELSDGLKAFYDDLAASGNEKRTLTMTFSEFGRRVAENASMGTDHGEAGPMFLIGGGVKGGVYGTHPSFDDLDDGDLKHNLDFRCVYATVLEKWFARPSSEVLPGNFPTLPMLG